MMGCIITIYYIAEWLAVSVTEYGVDESVVEKKGEGECSIGILLT